MNPSKENMQVKVGIFATIAFLLTLLVVFFLGSASDLFESQYELISRFDDISGLREGAAIQLAGVHAGTVGDILFDNGLEKKKVKLILKINEDYQERIREDSVATIVSQGLLGDKMVFIIVGSPDKRVLKDGDEIQTVAPTTFSELFDKGKALMEDVDQVVDSVNGILEEIQGGKGILHGLIYDIDGEKLVDDLNDVARNLNQASQNASQITTKVNQGQGTLGALVNDASLFNDMKTLLGKANRNKLVRAIIRTTLKTKEEKALKQ